MTSWQQVMRESPDFAARVQARFDAGTNKTLATLRRELAAAGRAGRLDVMAHDKSESDTSSDEHVAGSRATGGVPHPDAPGQASTTGTSPTPEFVGRVAGADESDVGESGAEARAEAARES